MVGTEGRGGNWEMGVVVVVGQVGVRWVAVDVKVVVDARVVGRVGVGRGVVDVRVEVAVMGLVGVKA